ncbi:FMN reductase (NADH) NtaB [Corynebacterium occultum]|uniref:FMN reductase (NADH) NtaB n=1 Tax=Corynebacterium occultum TaxID=2675219 RepID=A0A6B8VRP2_9CORY|nr:flavin reductase family protein [Corynebacterium occultum]QGU08232.1 FMN reductase (NADH) NtaB [Corynebacterium occultum]
MVISHPQTLTLQPIENGAPSDDVRAFRRTLGQFATGITVITTNTGEKLTGMTANSFTAVSLDPPLVLWSIRKESGSLAAFLESGHFSINILAENQNTVSEIFGRPRDEQFSQVEWIPGKFGAPLFPGSIAHLECETHEVIDAGDHHILIGRVDNYARFEGKPLLFSQGQFGVPTAFLESPQPAPAAGDPRLDLDNEQTIFMSLLKAANQQMSQLFQEHRHQVGVTVATGRVLNQLTVRADNVEDLGRVAFLGENTVEDALIELAGQNLVAPQAEGKWAITAPGLEVQAALRRSAAEFNAQQLRDIPVEDLAAAQRVLRTLINREFNSESENK